MRLTIDVRVNTRQDQLIRAEGEDTLSGSFWIWQAIFLHVLQRPSVLATTKCSIRNVSQVDSHESGVVDENLKPRGDLWHDLTVIVQGPRELPKEVVRHKIPIEHPEGIPANVKGITIRQWLSPRLIDDEGQNPRPGWKERSLSHETGPLNNVS